MDKGKNLVGLFSQLKNNTDSSYYQNLITLLEFKLESLQALWPKAVEPVEMHKLQGRALELEDLIKGLTRKQIQSQQNGGYGS